jgi:hypothetical protein
MKVQMLGVVLLAASFGTASAYAHSSGTTVPAQSQNREAPGTVRVVGCVERADQVMPLAGAALGTTVDSQEFVLIRAQIAGEPGAAPSTPTGTSGISPAATAKPQDPGQMFRLDAAPALMNPQVGHRVEVVGSRDSSAPAPSTGSDPSNPTAATAPLLRVSSIKTIADTCAR